MEGTEIRKLVTLEDDHWWYRERRHLLRQRVRDLAPGQALDIGAAGGGNTRVLQSLGWDVLALEFTAEGAEVARERGLQVVRADAQSLPVHDQSLDLITALDVLEHLPDDEGAAAEIHRVLRPGGILVAAVPVDQRLWSEHDVAVGHQRRYAAADFMALLQGAGLEVLEARSWMVLLRPAVAWHRRRSQGSDLTRPHPLTNAALTSVVRLERHLPVSRAPGVSLFVTARRRR
ncbi:class I SAM-dependent methyltransferase [Ornithinimicrobium sp. F0845]|uniref:class I SAM-dependent methyltransferase n=1 Tax=Ornithinimicrobium sp. F0845 TaxID=2926412 RepID=UPI001FF26A84|nr:class I SAM-dependent methyltransferase [Ornithinimicrobium sp. F0845]MCK0111219.1 class I SAM-dependent methyltransferase [Ornithinimicrobium sp. F0845]